jgi:stage II sporulation protein D
MKLTPKGILAAAVVLLIFTSILSHLMPKEKQATDETGQQKQINEIIIVTDNDEAMISMYNHWDKKLVEMPLEEYLIGVIAGEMPASYEIEALKAQTVAARTLVIYQMPAFGGRGCNQHPDADVCSSYAHCQEWISEERMRNNWGADFENNIKKIRQAIQETRGQIMTYDGKPIEVFYHSTSNGKTEEVSEVFSNSLPYYTTVESIGEENAPMYEGSVTLSNNEFIEKFYSKYGVKLDANNLASQIKINSYTDSGRIRDITVGGKRLRATEFRLLYGLNSTDITFVFDKNSITMKTKGFGHGVGMSQVGANSMAQQGYNYKDILLHYYKGVEISHY